MPDVVEIIAEIASGSVGDVVYSRNVYGPYTRPRTPPDNSFSTARSQAKTRFITLANAWAALTPAQRHVWHKFAGENRKWDRIWQRQTQTGQNLFVELNAPRLQAGKTTLVEPPAGGTKTALRDPEIFACNGGRIAVTMFLDDPWNTVNGGFVMCQTSPPISPARNFHAAPYRYSTTQTRGATPLTNPRLFNVAFFIPVGTRVFARFKAFLPTGEHSHAAYAAFTR